jgi:hypothetical protein
MKRPEPHFVILALCALLLFVIFYILVEWH